MPPPALDPEFEVSEGRVSSNLDPLVAHTPPPKPPAAFAEICASCSVACAPSSNARQPPEVVAMFALQPMPAAADTEAADPVANTAPPWADATFSSSTGLAAKIRLDCVMYAAPPSTPARFHCTGVPLRVAEEPIAAWIAPPEPDATLLDRFADAAALKVAADSSTPPPRTALLAVSRVLPSSWHDAPGSNARAPPSAPALLPSTTESVSVSVALRLTNTAPPAMSATFDVTTALVSASEALSPAAAAPPRGARHCTNLTLLSCSEAPDTAITAPPADAAEQSDSVSVPVPASELPPAAATQPPSTALAFVKLLPCSDSEESLSATRPPAAPADPLRSVEERNSREALPLACSAPPQPPALTLRTVVWINSSDALAVTAAAPPSPPDEASTIVQPSNVARDPAPSTKSAPPATTACTCSMSHELNRGCAPPVMTATLPCCADAFRSTKRPTVEASPEEKLMAGPSPRQSITVSRLASHRVLSCTDLPVRLRPQLPVPE
mmetsp:Transcript_10304/g.32648  ORF Transcript_10304/g.32648 Transcript_10304/m.32648 type:complete len:498 (-) Transcript_10304:6176-7669(-)